MNVINTEDSLDRAIVLLVNEHVEKFIKDISGIKSYEASGAIFIVDLTSKYVSILSKFSLYRTDIMTYIEGLRDLINDCHTNVFKKSFGMAKKYIEELSEIDSDMYDYQDVVNDALRTLSPTQIYCLYNVDGLFLKLHNICYSGGHKGSKYDYTSLYFILKNSEPYEESSETCSYISEDATGIAKVMLRLSGTNLVTNNTLIASEDVQFIMKTVMYGTDWDTILLSLELLNLNFCTIYLHCKRKGKDVTDIARLLVFSIANAVGNIKSLIKIEDKSELLNTLINPIEGMVSDDFIVNSTYSTYISQKCIGRRLHKLCNSKGVVVKMLNEEKHSSACKRDGDIEYVETVKSF